MQYTNLDYKIFPLITKDGKEYFLLNNGGLAPKEQVESLQNPETFTIDISEVEEYCNGCKEIITNKEFTPTIIANYADRNLRLFRTDRDVLTGLLPEDFLIFEDIEKLAIQKNVIKNATEIIYHQGEMMQVATEAGINANMCRKYQGVFLSSLDRLEHTTKKIEAVVNQYFETRSFISIDNPVAYLPIGCPGSGKSRLLEIAKNECGDNGVVVASLDEARTFFTLIWEFNIGHDVDYYYLTKISTLVRNLLIDHAIEHKFNLFRDGTGIPFSSISGIIERAKAVNYNIKAMGITATLETVLERVKMRAKKTNRNVPEEIVRAKFTAAENTIAEAKGYIGGLIDDFREYENNSMDNSPLIEKVIHDPSSENQA